MQRVHAWRDKLDAWHHQALRRVGETFRAAGGPDAPVGLSVVVLAADEPTELERCLRSVAAQTIGHDRLDVTVLAHGKRHETREAVDALRDSSITVRTIRLDRISAGVVYDVGVAAARGEYITFVDARDSLPPELLETLLSYAAPQVVPVAVADSVTAADPGLGQMLALLGGKLVPTRLARTLPYRRDLLDEVGPLQHLLFWATAAVDGRVRFQACPPLAGTGYHRCPAPDPTITTMEQVGRLLDLVAELARLADQADPPILEPLRRQIDTMTDLLGAYLRRHPDDRTELVTALDRRPISHLPYHRMNRDLSAGLVIAYAFPPYADTSGIVMAKRIRARGSVADVVFNAMDSRRRTDPSTRRIAGPFIRDEAMIRTPTYFSDWTSMERFTLDGMSRIREWTATKGPYEWVYSRAHFAASHILAATYKFANPAAAWIAEFSDPLSRGRQNEEQGSPIRDGEVLAELRAGLRETGAPVPASANCLVWCEEIPYAVADELVFTNHSQLEYMLSYCSNPELAALARKKAVVSPHPTLPTEFYSMVDADYPLDHSMANLGYFGVSYATRGLDDLLAAIAECEPAVRSRLRLHVFTTEPEPLQRRAAELGIEQLIRVGGYLPYLSFLNLSTRLDCLVVNDTATQEHLPRNPFLPSKWSDYRGSGTPVWGLVEPGSSLSRQPLDHASPIGDLHAARDVLSRVVRHKLTGKS